MLCCILVMSDSLQADYIYIYIYTHTHTYIHTHTHIFTYMCAFVYILGFPDTYEQKTVPSFFILIVSFNPYNIL